VTGDIVEDDGSIQVDVQEIYQRLDQLGRALFDCAQKDVVIEKLQKALADATNARNERPVKAA
jgi:hypothetical protein